MKHYDLTDEEQKELHGIEIAFENGEPESAVNFDKEKKRLQKIARNTLDQPRNINIRLSERDLYSLKVRATEEGISYQTLASSILHKYIALK